LELAAEEEEEASLAAVVLKGCDLFGTRLTALLMAAGALLSTEAAVLSAEVAELLEADARVSTDHVAKGEAALEMKAGTSAVRVVFLGAVSAG
jgi:hypothetical protein